jgi:regulatory subunit for Cdc7p protein kinase
VDVPAGSSANDNQSQSTHPQTINPLLLDRSSESTAVQFEGRSSKSKFTFEAPIGRKAASVSQDVDIRRQQGRNADVLHRARELGMKIWAQEKLERMMITMFDTDTGLQIPHGHNTRSNASQGIVATAPRTGPEADLSQLLRNERINGPSDRDPTVATKEMVFFKGPFIYIHDIDEKQRPIMVREYAKVSRKEDGDWPQFRSVSNGKCPFIEEIDNSRRDAEKEMARQQKHLEREKPVAPRTRAATAAVEETRMEPPKTSNNRGILTSLEKNAINGQGYDAGNESESISTVPENRPMSLKGPQNAFVSRAGAGRLFGGEPVASGLQPSNITSAIRSQMISSTAAAPGAKAGTSKEVHGLQRKVLERNSGPASIGLTSSHRMTDLATVTKDDTAVKLTRWKAQEGLAMIEEDISPAEVEGARQAEAARKAKAIQKRKSEKRDLKPGYCENCLDKFDDFDEVMRASTSGIISC